MKNRVLISCVGNKVALVKAFQQSGWYVIGTDKDMDVAGYHFCDEFHQHNFTEFTNDIPFGVDLVVPTYDGELMHWAEHKSKLGIPVMVADPPVIYTCTNKRVFHDFADNKQYTYRQARKKIKNGIRVFLQSSSGGGGSITSHLIKTLEDLNYWNGYYFDTVIQPVYYMPEYTIDLFTDFDGNILSIVPRKRRVVRNGESWVGQICMNRSLIHRTKKLAKKLKLIGHNTLQCFYDGDKIHWIEINARYGGGFPLAYAAGMDTPKILLRLINGQKPDKLKINDGLMMYRYTENLFI